LATSIGFFGKLPGYGDFIDRNLPRSFVEVWDEWLQRAMSGSRQMLSESWLDSYLTSPLWRFGLSSGCVDGQAWIGVILPSVDRVGRYFPLTIAMPVSSSVNISLALFQNAVWFKRLHDIGMACLQESPTVEAVVEVLRQLDDPQFTPWRNHPSQVGMVGNCVTVHNGSDVKPAQSDVSLKQSLTFSEALMRQHNASFSLWYTEGSEHTEDVILSSEFLPDPMGYVAMLTGQWQQFGWNKIC
jgi:type VI secretion system protein ImpM